MAVQSGDCGELRNLEAPLGPEGREGCRGCRCALLKELLEQMGGLQREIGSLRGSWESLRETGRRCEPTPTEAQQPPPKSLQRVAAEPAGHLQDRELDSPREERGRTLVSAQSRRRRLPPTPMVPPTPTVSLGNRFEALGQERDEGLESSWNSGPKKHIEVEGSSKHRERDRSGHCIKRIPSDCPRAPQRR